MPARIPWLALGVGAYVAFAVAFFPASVAYRWFAPSEVRLSGVEGTLWSGQAALGSVGEFGLHEIEWELQPWSLALGRVGGQVQTRFSDGFLTTRVRAGFGGVDFTELRATSSLAALSGVLPIRGTRGQASANFAELVVQDGWPIGAVGELRLGELAVPPLVPVSDTDLIPLGNYSINFADASGQGLVGTFRDQGGPLEVMGSLRLNPNRDYLIEGVVRARPEAVAALTQGLAFMTGEPDSSGMRTFSLAGSL